MEPNCALSVSLTYLATCVIYWSLMSAFCLDRPDVHTLKMVPPLLESHRFFTNIDRKSVESYAC